MTRDELVEALAVERHAPAPREPRFRAPTGPPPEPITEVQARRNRRTLSDATGSDDPWLAEWTDRSA